MKKFGISFAQLTLTAIAMSLFVVIAISGQSHEPASASPAVGEAHDRSDSDLADRAYHAAESIFEQADVVHYKHYHHVADEQVRNVDSRMVVETDCSGFISYVVHAVAPKHYHVIKQMQPSFKYPQAKTYARFFGTLDPSAPYSGWLGVASYRDLRRGDIVAWEKGASVNDHGGHGNSGHVMMVLDPPSAVQMQMVNGKQVRYASVHVLDSSSVYHFAPEALPPNAHQSHRDGLGKGYIRLILGDGDKVVGYWEGTYWGEGGKQLNKPSTSNMIHFGRLVNL